MLISQFKDKKVALWGWGKEGKAAWQAIRYYLPTLSLVVLCNKNEAAQLLELNDPYLSTETDNISEQLVQFNYIIKSPGISAYLPEIMHAKNNGVQFVSGTAIWFSEQWVRQIENSSINEDSQQSETSQHSEISQQSENSPNSETSQQSPTRSHAPAWECLSDNNEIFKSQGGHGDPPLHKREGEFQHIFNNNYIKNTLCITGTKGKSTTSSLVAHLLREAGKITGLVGNIGMPLLEQLHPEIFPEYWVIELSSYQTMEVAKSNARPMIALGLNVYPEHLNWHGNQQQYIQDKLALFIDAKPKIAILNAKDPILLALSSENKLPESHIIWFNHIEGWHLREDYIFNGEKCILDARKTLLAGEHNYLNLCAALTLLQAAGLDAEKIAELALTFKPLPHRLQLLGEQHGLRWVNDSISTTPYASLAALKCFKSQQMGIILGGFDRGIEWHEFVTDIEDSLPNIIITTGQNGPKIFELLSPLAAQNKFRLFNVAILDEAVQKMREYLPKNGVVLLSPGAPSLDQYPDHTARGRHFAELAGFNPDAINTIGGMGVW